MTDIFEAFSRNSKVTRKLVAQQVVPNPLLVMSSFLSLPGLRGFWSMGAFDSSGNVMDQSGHGHNLTYNGDPVFAFDTIVPYIDMDGTGDYLSRADEADLDFSGTESYVNSANRGFTVGGWFSLDSLTKSHSLISKYRFSGGDNRSFLLGFNVTEQKFEFRISSAGTSTSLVTVYSSITPEISKWFFAIGRFIASTEMSIFVNDIEDIEDSSAPSVIYNGTAALEIGGSNAGASNLLSGKASCCFISSMYLSDKIIGTLYNLTKRLYV